MTETVFQVGKTYGYTIQCKDQITGQTGNFVYDPDQGNTAGNFKALSPVFPEMTDLCRYMVKNDFFLPPSYDMTCIFEGKPQTQHKSKEDSMDTDRVSVNQLRNRRVTVSELAAEYGLKAFDTAMPIEWISHCQASGFDPRGSVVWSYDRNSFSGEPFPLTVEAAEALKVAFPGIDIPPVPGSVADPVDDEYAGASPR